MIKKAIRAIITLVGMSFGYLIYILLYSVLGTYMKTYIKRSIYLGIISIIITILFGIIFYFLSPIIIEKGQKFANYIQNEIINVPLPELLTSVAGFAIAIIIAYFLSSPIKTIPYIGIPMVIAMYIFLGYIGTNIGRIKKDEISRYFQSRKITYKEKSSKKNTSAMPKILDTSVIIDGRINEIIETGFVEGKIVIPTFVLEELRHIADSSDDLKRAKGRRGLDILKELQNNKKILVEINDSKFDDVNEVDIKLLKLAEKINGAVLTNDYNLNKVAQLHNVVVLNINELSNAVKPQMIPGEQTTVQIVKEGKENSQGVAYLNDGTMIVVENGKKYIGATIDVEVTSVLQTPAGRMIFAKLK